jgi:peptide deformylase
VPNPASGAYFFMKILIYPDPRLKQKAKPVQEFNKKLEKLCRKMFDLMYKENGVGLAATQVGENQRIIVMNPTKKSADEVVLLNPRLLKTSGKACQDEGCLSLPGISAPVDRFEKVTIEAYDLSGKRINADLEDVLARIIQHEMDHLDGVLFVDRVPADKKKVLLEKYFNASGAGRTD